MQMTKIYDSHCHIYPHEISHKAVKAIDHFYEGLPVKAQDGTTDTLLKTGEENGISRYLALAVATRPDQVSHINRYLAGKVKQSGGILIGLGTLHPDSENPERDMEELVSSGLKGVKLHPDIQKFRVDDPKAMRIFAMCEERNMPVCVHTGDFRYDYSNPGRTVHVLQAFPELTFIGAHFGGWSVWDDALRLLPDYPNIIVDTSSSFFWLKPEKALQLIRAYGSKRVMFGTDYPMWDQKKEIEYLTRLDLTEKEMEDISWRTMDRLFSTDI